MDRLEQNVQQLQMNLSSAHQRHKADCSRYEEQVATLKHELADAQSRGQLLQQDVDRKDEQIKRNEAEISSCRDNIHAKADEVRMGLVEQSFSGGNCTPERERETNVWCVDVVHMCVCVCVWVQNLICVLQIVRSCVKMYVCVSLCMCVLAGGWGGR